MNNAKAVALATLYELYKMYIEGVFDKKWKLNKILAGPEFCQVAKQQICHYQARDCKYQGDEFLCSSTCLLLYRRQGGAGEQQG